MKIEMFVRDRKNSGTRGYFSFQRGKAVLDLGETWNDVFIGETWNDVFMFTGEWISLRCNVCRFEKCLGVRNRNVKTFI